MIAAIARGHHPAGGRGESSNEWRLSMPKNRGSRYGPMPINGNSGNPWKSHSRAHCHGTGEGAGFEARNALASAAPRIPAKTRMKPGGGVSRLPKIQRAAITASRASNIALKAASPAATWLRE